MTPINIGNPDEPRLPAVQVALGIVGSVVIRSGSTAAVKSVFRAQANTGTARYAQLALALAAAGDNDIIDLQIGDFTIPAGSPMVSLVTGENVHVVCRDGASHVYTDPNDAKLDHPLFVGQRNVVHFGAFPKPQLEESGIDPDTDYAEDFDSSSAFRAALNSFPPINGSHLDADGNVTRTGCLYVPGGPGTWYYFSDPIVMQQSNELASEQRGITFCALGGMAPVLATDVYFIRMALNAVGPNFTHDVKLSGGFTLTSFAGNPGLCAAYWGGAQVNEIDLAVFGLKRGVIFPSGTTFLKVKNLDCTNLTHGPALDFQGDSYINIIELGACSAFFCNSAWNEENGRPIPAYRFRGVVAMFGTALLAEQCPAAAEFDSCRAVTITAIDHQKPASFPPGSESIAVRLINSFFMGPFAVRGQDVDYLVVDNLGQTVPGGAGFTFTRYETNTHSREAAFGAARILNGLTKGFRVQRDDSVQTIKSMEFGAATGDPTNPTWTFRGLDAAGGFVKEFIRICNHAGGGDTGYEVFLPPTSVTGNLRVTGSLFTDGTANVTQGYKVNQSASDPLAANIPSTYFGVWKNTGSGVVKLWTNDGGTMKSVTLT